MQAQKHRRRYMQHALCRKKVNAIIVAGQPSTYLNRGIDIVKVHQDRLKERIVRLGVFKLCTEDSLRLSRGKKEVVKVRMIDVRIERCLGARQDDEQLKILMKSEELMITKVE